jgi:hypothetical protein
MEKPGASARCEIGAGPWSAGSTALHRSSACWTGGVSNSRCLRLVRGQLPYPERKRLTSLCYNKVEGSHLTATASPATASRPAEILELDAAGDRITGVQKRGDTTVALAGVRAPELKREVPQHHRISTEAVNSRFGAFPCVAASHGPVAHPCE